MTSDTNDTDRTTKDWSPRFDVTALSCMHAGSLSLVSVVSEAKSSRFT